MKRKVIKKQCTVTERIKITNFYDIHGYAATCKQYPYICKSTLYNWLARRKNPNKTLHPDSRRPHKTKRNLVKLFYKPIVEYKLQHPNCACIQIQRHFQQKTNYFKISVSTIWRALQKYEQIEQLVRMLDDVKNKKLTGTFEIPVSRNC